MTVEVKVFEADNATEVVNLTASRQVREAKGKDVLQGVGNGEVAVDFDHPAVGELTGGRVVQLHDGERVPLAFSIDKKREVLVPSEPGDANRLVTVSGQTLRGRLSKARVLPWLPVAFEGVEGSRPITRRRLFNPASPSIDLTAWTGAVMLPDTPTNLYGRPRGWPSAVCRWIWSSAPVDDAHPPGWNYFRRRFELFVDATMVFLVTGDNQFIDWLEGVELQREEPTLPEEVWPEPYRSGMKLKAGVYDYTVAVYNDDSQGPGTQGPGKMRAEAWVVNSEGLNNQVFMSGVAGEGFLDGEWDEQFGEGANAWKVLAYPELGDAGYGHTVGEIMDTLLTEAQARGELTGFTWDFDGALDSNGDAWADRIPEIDFDATGTLGDAVDKLEDLGYCDVEVTHSGGLQLRLFNAGARGSVQPITVSTAEKNLLSHSVETNYVDQRNSVLLVHDRGMYLMDDDDAIAADGQLPGGSLQVGSVQSPEMLERLGTSFLDGSTTPGESVIVETTPMFDFAAEPGDSCTVESDVLRVVELGLQLDTPPQGELKAVPAFATAYQQQRKRSERVVERLIRENGTSPASTRALDTGTNIRSGKLAPVKVTSWSWQIPEDLESEFWDTDEEEPVGWQPFPVEESMRICELKVECFWAEPDGLGGRDAVTSGPTTFVLMVDGVPFTDSVTVPATGDADGSVTASHLVFGPALVRKGQKLSVYPQVNGDHINGSFTVFCTEPL